MAKALLSISNTLIALIIFPVLFLRRPGKAERRALSGKTYASRSANLLFSLQKSLFAGNLFGEGYYRHPAPDSQIAIQGIEELEKSPGNKIRPALRAGVAEVAKNTKAVP